MYCQKCGIPIPDASEFCHKCGHPTIVTGPQINNDSNPTEPNKKGNRIFIKIIIIFLVVLFILAIIGILASVVLASMNEARAKARDAKIESNLSTIIIKAENYKDLNGSYLGLCEDSEISLLTLTNSSSTKPYTEITCNDNEQAYAVSASLSNTKESEPMEYFCVDSTGVATKTTSKLSENQIHCEIISSEFETLLTQVFVASLEDVEDGMTDLVNEEIGKKMESIAQKLLELSKSKDEEALANAWMAKAQTNLGDFDLALQYINKSIELDPDSNLSCRAKADIYRGTENFNSAISTGKECVTLAQKKQNSFSESLSELGLSLSYSYKSKQTKDINDLVKAQEHAQKAILLNPYCNSCKRIKFDIIITQVFLYGEEGKFDKAIAILDTLITQSNPNEDEYLLSRAYSVRGVIKGDSGNRNEAISDLEKSLEIYPDDDKEAYYNIAVQYDYLKQYEKSFESFEKSLALDPENKQSFSNEEILRAMIITSFHAYDAWDEITVNKKMAEIRTKLIAYNPDDILDQYELRAIAYEMAKEYQKAADAYMAYLDLYIKKGDDPEDVTLSTLSRIASMQYYVGQYKDSCSNLEKAEVLHEKLKVERVNHYSWDFRYDIEDNNKKIFDLVQFCKDLKS